MSSMLEQAIIDAAALKEAAMKNAESIIIDKTRIVSGAMKDITFRTNPVILDESDVGIVFDNAMNWCMNV